MKKQLQILLLLLTLTIACKKRGAEPEPEYPQPPPIVTTPVTNTNKGSLSGTVSPAEAISKITATLAQGGQKYTIQIINGIFSASELPEGTYTLDYTPNDFYVKPSSTTLAVTSGKNTEAGAISLKKKSGTISCYVNEQYQCWSLKGYNSGTLLQIVKYTLGTGIPELDIKMNLTYDLGITLSPFNGPGTYTCDPSTRSGISYKLIKGALPISIQDTQNPGSSATVVITSVDPVTRTIKGTFTAFLAARPSSSGDARTITNGVIDAKY